MIFWEHIKGLNGTSGAEAWTYVNFIASLANNLSMTNNPSIGFGASGYTVNDNHILTSNMINGYINNSFTFKNSVTWSNSTNSLVISFASPSWQINANTILKIVKGLSIGEKLEVLDTTDASTSVYNQGAVQVAGGVGIAKKLFVGDSVKIINRCDAKFFNATSDYRAKKDFKILDIDALELVKKVQLYSFKYKESNRPSIGIIAQDIQDVNINGFDLVDNKEATGENFDYMSIHESKLIYILWKAIQEQQKEIEELKEELKK